MHDASPTAYRPRVVTGLFFAGSFIATAAVLFVVGFVVRPEDREAVDGFARLLFTVVPMQLFAWAFVPVFLGLGALVLGRTLRRRPSLVVAEGGVTLPSGRTVPWGSVASASAAGGVLSIEVAGGGGRDEPPEMVRVSSFALGADPDEVARRLIARLPGMSDA